MKFLPAVVVTSAVLLLQTAYALDRLCINGDNRIKQLFIDGVSYIDKLDSKKDYTKCDCIKIPLNSALIAVEAQMRQPPGRIQACNTAKPALFKDWVCKRVKYPGEDSKGLRPKWKNWFRSGYDFRRYGWKPPRKENCTDHCHNQYYKLPCNMPDSPCFWLDHDAAANTIRCRLLRCADSCNSCRTAGPGKCDPDACKHGSGNNELTGVTSCQRRCRLEIQAYGTNSLTGEGYIKVIDMTTRDFDIWKADKAGDYYATVDMSTCSITNRNYFEWKDSGKGVQLYNGWNLAGSEYINLIGIELGVGKAPSGDFSYAPWILANSLGYGIAIPPAWFPNNQYAFYGADLQGVQHGEVKVTNNSTRPAT